MYENFQWNLRILPDGFYSFYEDQVGAVIRALADTLIGHHYNEFDDRETTALWEMMDLFWEEAGFFREQAFRVVEYNKRLMEARFELGRTSFILEFFLHDLILYWNGSGYEEIGKTWKGQELGTFESYLIEQMGKWDGAMTQKELEFLLDVREEKMYCPLR